MPEYFGPTADQYAWAIVTACRATGEDPVALAERKEAIRARHYVLHAMAFCYPSVHREQVARFVGCPGKPEYFWRNSKNQVANPTGGNKASRETVSWWNWETYQAVIDAIERQRPARQAIAIKKAAAPAPKPQPREIRPTTPKPAPAPRSLLQAPAASIATYVPVGPPVITAKRTKLEQMLFDAVNTTRAMEPPKERQPDDEA